MQYRKYVKPVAINDVQGTATAFTWMFYNTAKYTATLATEKVLPGIIPENLVDERQLMNKIKYDSDRKPV